jgi:hypothetical protein
MTMTAAVGGDSALRFLPLALSLKPQRHKDFLRRREGQTAHYGLRKILRCAPILLQNSRRYFVDISDGGITQISHDLISTKYRPKPP